MKKIQAIIKPLKLDDVKDKLNEIGIGGLTVSEVKGVGKQGGKGGLFVTAPSTAGLPKVCLEIVVEDNRVEEVIAAILQSGSAGRVGDGKIFVTALEDVIRVRTGEHGSSAI